jgi:hypothetical protein
MNKIIYSGTQTDACGKTGNDLDFLFYYAIIYVYIYAHKMQELEPILWENEKKRWQTKRSRYHIYK